MSIHSQRTVIEYGRPYLEQVLGLLKRAGESSLERGESISLRRLGITQVDSLGPNDQEQFYRAGLEVQVDLHNEDIRTGERILRAFGRQVRTVTVESVRIKKRQAPPTFGHLSVIEAGTAIDSLVWSTQQALHVDLPHLAVEGDDEHWWLSVPVMMPVDEETDDGDVLTDALFPPFDVLA